MTDLTLPTFTVAPADAPASGPGGIARDLGELQCPTLMFFGDQDHYIPMSDIEAVQARHDDAVVVYPGADHGFMRDGSENYDEASATDAWGRLLAFFDEHLR